MEAALVYGGLTDLGLKLCEQLLEKGTQVISISSAKTDIEREIEEDNELFIGRNDLFRHDACVDYINQIEPPIRHVYLLDPFKETEDFRKKVMDDIEDIFTAVCQKKESLATVVMQSSIEIYGQKTGIITERTAVNPVSKKGKAANSLEQQFINLLLKNKMKNALILRMADIHLPNAENTGLSIDVIDAADAVKAMTNATLVEKNGLQVIQVTSGQTHSLTDHSGSTGGDYVLPYDKATRLLDYKPQDH